MLYLGYNAGQLAQQSTRKGPHMTKDHPPGKHHCRDLEDIKPLVEQLGYQISGGCWQNEYVAFAFSAESYRNDYGNPMVEVRLDKQTGWLSVTSPSPR